MTGGRIFIVGDNVDTDQLAPGKYMRGGIEALAAHCLEGLRPDFAGAVRPGDLLVAGRNFGAGSSREQAAAALKHLGIAAVLARSFAGIFYRNAVNLGLPVLVLPEAEGLAEGDFAVLDLDTATLTLPGKGITLSCEPIPENLRTLLSDGGLVRHLKKRFAMAREAAT